MASQSPSPVEASFLEAKQTMILVGYNMVLAVIFAVIVFFLVVQERLLALPATLLTMGAAGTLGVRILGRYLLSLDLSEHILSNAQSHRRAGG